MSEDDYLWCDYMNRDTSWSSSGELDYRYGTNISKQKLAVAWE